MSKEPPTNDSDDERNAIVNIAHTPPAHSSTPHPRAAVTADEAPPDQEAVEKKRSRKRKRVPKDWEINKISADYNNGTRYKKKGVITQRSVGARCSCKRKKCNEMSDEERKRVHQAFWNLSNQTTRANYIIGHTSKIIKKRQVIDSQYNRGENFNYFLPKSDDSKLSVCKRFFQNTLCISDKMISYNWARSVDGVKPPTIRPPPATKICDESMQTVSDHINSFPTVESHYCRSSTHRRYLDPSLNKSKMYRMYEQSNLYHRSIKQHMYSKIFDEQFNLGFHKPSKDLCDHCDKYNKRKLAGDLTEEMEEDKVQHDKRKIRAREEKEKDKKNTEVMTITCDLQQVLTAPRFFAGSSYYKRKLNLYNFTVYELPTNEGICYTWTEAECHKGANDVASCIVKYLEQIDTGGKYTKVVIYSDTCGGQNRNRIVCTAIASFLSGSSTVNTVEQKFFESGHSHMECDSMHSAIEGHFKHKEIALPSEYLTAMTEARPKQPYKVIEMEHADIKDFDALNEEAFKKDAFKGIIKTHYIKYIKSNDIQISMNENIEEPLKTLVWRKRGAPKSLVTPKQAYDQQCGIDKDKKADLLSMCDLASCKSIYNLYYRSLSVKN